MHNFTVIDILAGSLGFLLFALFALVPGYVVAWAADILAFRKQNLITRLTLAVPLSIALSPALAYVAARWLSSAAAWVVFAILWIAFPVILISEFRRAVPSPIRLTRPARIFLAIILGWLLLGLLSLADIQWKDRLYFSVVSYDYTLRTAFTASISNTGIPPANPYFSPGQIFPLRYHYFWLIPCSLVQQLGAPFISARNALIAGTLWVGLGLLAIVALYLRFVHPMGQAHSPANSSPRLARRTWIGLGLLLVTGLDILPNLVFDLLRHPLPDPEWWNTQVSSWITTVLFIPHHAASLIAGLTAVLIIWNVKPEMALSRRAVWSLMAGLCLATCVGASIYVAVVLGMWLMLWTAIAIVKGWRKEAIFVVSTGLLAILVIAPHLIDLRGSFSGAPGAVGPLLEPKVREFVLTNLFRPWIDSSALRKNFLDLLFLPLNYFLELGLFFGIGVSTVRHYLRGPHPLDRYRLATLSLASVSVVVCSFVRSSLIPGNDLGWRGFLFAQFVFVLWAVDILDRPWALRRVARWDVKALIILGVLGSLNEVASLRAYPIVSDLADVPRYQWLAMDHELGRRTYALRTVYEQLKTELPPGAIVQHNPNGIPGDLPYGLYADRPVAAETPGCGILFGGDPKLCVSVLASLKPVFEGSLPAGEVDRTCSEWSISALLVKDTDPAWSDKKSWVWQRPPSIANEFVRTFPCGERTPTRSARAPN